MLYYLGHLFYIFGNYFKIFGKEFQKITLVLGLSFFIIDIFKNKKIKKSTLIILIGSLVISFVIKQMTLFIFLLIIFSSNKVNFYRFSKFYFFMTFSLFNLILILSKLDFLKINYHLRIKGSKIILRSDLGFGNPNSVFLLLLACMSSYLYWRYKKINLLEFIFWNIFLYYLFKNTGSRTGYLILFFQFNYFYFKRKKRISYFAVYKYFPLILTLISLILMKFFYNDKLINKIFTKRPVTWKINFDNILWNKNLFFGASKRIVALDNGYLENIYSNGILVFILIIIILTLGIHKVLIEKKKKILLLYLPILIYGVSEMVFVNTVYGIIPILIGKNGMTLLLKRIKK